MKTKYPSIFGILAIFMLVASLVVPVNLASPTTAEASYAAGICKWDTPELPNSVVGKYDLLMYSEIDKLEVCPDDMGLLAVVSRSPNDPYYWKSGTGVPASGNLTLMWAKYKGIIWSTQPYEHLVNDMDRKYSGIPGGEHNVFDVACAPDDSNFWAVVTSGNYTALGTVAWANEPVEVWITEDAGANWECTGLVLSTDQLAYAGDEHVGCIDISADYGGKRDIAVGMRQGNGTAAFSIWVLQSSGYTGWNLQTVLPTATADVVDLKFSPTYVGDASMAVVYATATTGNGTWFDVAQRDLDDNDIASWVYSASVEVCSTTPGTSPTADQLITADLELPSDFSGQSASLRRAYVSTYGPDGTVGIDGIFRVDDTTVYTLMDCGMTTNKNISTIAYYGTYASGKLLAGEVKGDGCWATVPTWFTDSPTTCPVPCWYPALKPTTGAAGAGGACGVGNGNAQVAWSVTGEVAYVGTGSVTWAAGANDWWGAFIVEPVSLDETAFAISRNNGETWNQLGMIDTYITRFNDVAPSADCTTIYLASYNNMDVVKAAAGYCIGFDSVWRTSINSAVTSPLLGVLPLSFYYERVYCRPTSLNCGIGETQTDLPLLRLAPAPDDEDGEIVFWAAQDPATSTYDSGIAAWSPDFGDYWANINPRDPIQDFTAASNTMLFFLSPDGLVQKMPYTGTAWSSIEASVYSADNGHMIATYGEDDVLVGYDSSATYPGAISHDGGATFATLLALLPTDGDAHVAFHPDYADNGIFFLADGDSSVITGSVYRNRDVSGGLLANGWADGDMMAATNGAYGCVTAPHQVGQYGLQLATTGAGGDYALYSAHDAWDVTVEDVHTYYNSGVCRTLNPLWGLPKPGMFWDCLDVGLSTASANFQVAFTNEPWSLKKCGCLTMDTDTILWALDNRAYYPEWLANALGYPKMGYLWGFSDCMAKVGPTLTTEDGMLIGCDVVSGRAQEVNFEWEQLCVAVAYDIEIGKTADFNIKVIDWASEIACPAASPATLANFAAVYLVPSSTLSPAAFFPAGGAVLTGTGSAIAAYGNLECGHTYYWRVKVRGCATGQTIRSPWSEVRSFTVKAGLPVRAGYYGLKLLSPDNGCSGCPVSPVSFSWSPFKETTKYKFVLAKDAALTDVLAEAEVATTAYEYEGTLDYSTNYFWRVMCLEPAPSDWSATFGFQTEAAPAAPEAPPEAPGTPLWAWIVIAIGTILAIVWVVSLVYVYRKCRK